MDKKNNILYLLDKFAIRNCIYFDKKEKDNSLFGFILTIIYLFIIFTIFLVYFKEIISKSSDVFVNSLSFEEFPLMELNSDLLYFYFALQNPLTNNDFKDEELYYPKAKYVSKYRKDNEWIITETEIELENCNLNKFGKKYRNLFKDKPLNNAYCFKNINYTLAGTFKANNWSYIDIDFYPCSNNSNRKCKSKEEIDKYVSEAYLTVQMENIAINLENYLSPVIPIDADIYTSVGKGIYRYYNLHLDIIEIQTDNGYILQKLNKQRYLQIGENHEIFLFRDENSFYNGESLCRFSITLSDQLKIYKRTYKKLWYLFASTGGWLQLISTLFSAISVLPVRTLHDLKVINKLFYCIRSNNQLLTNSCINFNLQSDFKVNKSSNRDGKKLKSKNLLSIHGNSNKNSHINIINNSSNIYINNNYLNQMNKNKLAVLNNHIVKKKKININKLKNEKVKVKNKINLSCAEIYFFVCFKHQNKHHIKLFQKWSNFYKDKLDIINLFNSILSYESTSCKRDLENSNENKSMLIENKKKLKLYNSNIVENEPE